MKNYKFLILSLIIFTTLPFFLLLTQIDFSLYNESQTIFWKNFWITWANIFGFIGTIFLFWQFILGIRLIMKIFSDDLIWITHIHKLIGKYGVLLVFLHPILSLISSKKSLLWFFIPDLSSFRETRITLGRFAIILVDIIFITSVLIRKRFKFRPWKYIHYLSYPILVLVFLHALDIGRFLNKFLFLKIFWFLIFFIFCCIVFFRLLYALGFFKLKCKLKSIKIVNEDLLILKISPQKNHTIPKPGQYFYLQLTPFGETHPFSVIEYDEKMNELIFGIKILGKFTKDLSELQINDEIFLEGPYGVFTQEAQNSKPKIIIAGGIGITPFVNLIKNYNENTILINCNRNLKDTIYRQKVKNYLGKNYYDCLSQENAQSSNQNMILQRLDNSVLKQIIDKRNANDFNYFICGSERFIEGIRKNLLDLNINQKNIFIEKFY